MSPTMWIYPLATLVAALGLWLMLPRGRAGGRAAGAVLGAAALGMWVSRWPMVGDWAANSVFFILAGVTLVAAVGTVTFRSPVYCAVWFGLALLGTAGLLLVIGAEFLAVATIVVYAGAILVTFLFLLLMADPEGRSPSDRRSWEALMSAATAAVIAGILSMALSSTLLYTAGHPLPIAVHGPEALSQDVLDPQHVARLGGELFSRHLVAVEVAGVVLLAALVGAAVITTQAKRR